MFSTLGLFKQLPCPEASNCSFKICLFSHDIKFLDGQNEEEPPQKRQKLNPTPESVGYVRDGSLRVGLPQKESVKLVTKSFEPKASVNKYTTTTDSVKSHLTSSHVSDNSVKRAESIKLNISGSKIIPPGQSTSSKSSRTESLASGKTSLAKEAPKAEPLQPRPLKNPPATIPVRCKLLYLLHDQLVRLNKLITASSEPSKKTLLLSDQELIKMALDEEHSTAMANPVVYTNVMKNRIGALKKADVKIWVTERSLQVKKDVEESEQKLKKRKLDVTNPRIETGLSYEQEKQFIPQLVASSEVLQECGYVNSVPLETEMEKARAGLDASGGWEVCDRCRCRFRAFSTRQEDGTLTTGGSCKHHWGRLVSAPRTVGGEPLYSCCQLPQGTPGCEEKPSHVFKVTNPARLATVVQFEETPKSEVDGQDQPICFDCEMAYTSNGMELIRLTATEWPSGKAVLDVLVRPKGEVLDLNTRFSGVSIEQWTQAKSWNSTELPPVERVDASKQTKTGDTSKTTLEPATALPIVPSPEHARSLLFKLIKPSTALIGHALENDLIAMRIVHPTIIDTVILFPHRRGLPLKNKLKFLVRDEIQWNIQDAGVEGHDSLEDALAAGELVRHKIRIKWEMMQRNGWTFKGDKLCEPESKT